MPFPIFDRRWVKMRALESRANKVVFERDAVSRDAAPGSLNAPAREIIAETAARIRSARAADRPRVMAFGAHAIKNCLSPIFIALMEEGWVTHLATNGAGIIHDWELAYQGATSEDVKANIAEGCFGTWEETGYYLNLALIVGAYEGLGYGESIGALVQNEELTIPSREMLERRIPEWVAVEPDKAAAAIDLLDAMRRFELPAGTLDVPHPHKHAGLQAAAYRLNVPLTGHPMFGHDILYEHALSSGAAIGRTAERDFLTFAHAINRIEGGVYVSLGSAVMSPMIFEKCFAMAQNVALQNGQAISNHFLTVVDLAKSHWDWTQGEPPENNPDYYLRYNKTFSRMGGTLRYVSLDHRDFLLALWHELRG